MANHITIAGSSDEDNPKDVGLVGQYGWNTRNKRKPVDTE